MRRWLLRRRLVLAAALVLLAVCAGVAEESFAHTDDGCPVEKHCLACRLATGSVAVMGTSLPVVAASAERPERVWTDTTQTRSQAAATTTPSRAPPFA